jgi:hypothetical protein
MLTQVKVVDNIEGVQQTVTKLQKESYPRDNIYVLTHEGDRTDDISDKTNTNKITIKEEGPYRSLANLVSPQGEILRRKMRVMGISDEKADRLEEQLDEGKIIVIGWNGEGNSNVEEDPSIVYHT